MRCTTPSSWDRPFAAMLRPSMMTSLILYMPSDGQDFADIEAYGVASWMCAAKYSAASSSCRNC